MSLAAPFDAMAAEYDEAFVRGEIGRLLRAAALQRIDATFVQGDSLLELNCGTGEDAFHLAARGVKVLATDKSPLMLDVVRRKLAGPKAQPDVKVARLDLADVAGGVVPPGPFDGVLSNFGGLNCIPDLAAIARSLAGVVRPGGKAVLGIMGPLVPWEWVWFLTHGEPARAFRRLRPGGVQWRGLTIHYPSIRAARRAFGAHWRMRRVTALGALLPPTYAERWAARHPHLLVALDRCERRLEAVWPFPWLADHYLIEFERKDGP